MTKPSKPILIISAAITAAALTYLTVQFPVFMAGVIVGCLTVQTLDDISK